MGGSSLLVVIGQFQVIFITDLGHSAAIKGMSAGSQDDFLNATFSIARMTGG